MPRGGTTSQSIDQRMGQRRALLHDARPSSDLQTYARGEGAPPSPGWLMPLETQTLGCSAIRESAPRGQQVPTASSHQLVYQKKTEQAPTGMRE